uniref:Uncharacterized protein n=1 Tax=Parastrongyloides trichosuri TaxID=131310 RepID=A0A0N4Z483_PARTI
MQPPTNVFSKPSFSTPASPAQNHHININFSKPSSPPPVPLKILSRSRILKIKRDETSAVDDEVAHERYMQTSQKVSLSFGDFSIDDSNGEIRKRANSCIEPITVLTSTILSQNTSSSSSPKASVEGNSSSLQKQCYSPSTNQIVENNLPYSPSPTPSPTRHRILRSCSPRTLLCRPPSINGIGVSQPSTSTITGLKRKRPDTLMVQSSPYQYDSDNESISSTASSSTSFMGTLFPTKKPKLARNCPSPLTKVSTTPTEGLLITNFSQQNELSYEEIMEFENTDNSSSSSSSFQPINQLLKNFIEPTNIASTSGTKISANNKTDSNNKINGPPNDNSIHNNKNCKDSISTNTGEYSSSFDSIPFTKNNTIRPPNNTRISAKGD